MKPAPVKRQLAASALPTVLVIGTLMLLAVLALLSLSDMEALLVYGNHSRRQKEAWLESALLLYSQDSTLLERLDESGCFRLFEGDPASEISVRRSVWGLYERVTVSAQEGKFRKSHLMGYESESPRKAALYVCNNRRAFTLAGRSNIKGTVYLPENGLLYGQVQSDFYSGDLLPETRIRQSEERLPPIVQASLDSLKLLFTDHFQVSIPEADEYRNSFFEPTARFQSGQLSGTTWQGNIVLSSPDRIEIDSLSRLEDVLVVAPRVYVREGFKGTLQIVAADSVVIESRVRLKYPSGIVIPEGTADSYIGIAENSEVNGYVIFRSASEAGPEKRAPHYSQQEDSSVRGLVWVDGIAQIHGTVTGSLYAGQSNYYTPQGYYMNLLYNTSVYGTTALAFPVWMQSYHTRKTVKWLD